MNVKPGDLAEIVGYPAEWQMNGLLVIVEHRSTPPWTTLPDGQRVFCMPDGPPGWRCRFIAGSGPIPGININENWTDFEIVFGKNSHTVVGDANLRPLKDDPDSESQPTEEKLEQPA